uniref:Biogenesis of lysosome-related organelles complex 1 subunit 7 n=1 Tax=Laticauda laticaudata TaxID=8630 RepID=A0A8C5RED1_LATLA
MSSPRGCWSSCGRPWDSWTATSTPSGRARWSCGSTSTAWLQVSLPTLPHPTPLLKAPHHNFPLLPSLPELCRINEDQKVALDLDPYVKKLLNARRRVVLVNNILQNAQVP